MYKFFKDRKPLTKIIISLIIVIVAVNILIRAFGYEPFRDPSKAMEPTIHQGAYFFAQKFDLDKIKRGDIIVFNKTDNHVYVKRIIGMPNDKIEYKKQQFYINGVVVPKTPAGEGKYQEMLSPDAIYIIEDNVTKAFESDKHYEVPADSYFVVGDNRANSNDSRMESFGFVKKSDVRGKVILDSKNSN